MRTVMFTLTTSPRLMKKEIIDAGFQIGRGTSSDISHMTSLGIACFNVGIGYKDEHDPRCWADLRVLERQLERFSTFYNGARNKLFVDEGINRKKENKFA